VNTKTTTSSASQLALPLTTPIATPTTTDDRPSREDRLAAAHAVLARGLAGVRSDPDALRAFLAFRGRFRDYSLNNTVLIWLQRPTARYCMGFRAWQRHGRQVRRGERGITVLAPIVRKATEADLTAGKDPKERAVVGYRTTTTFDYEQTEAVSPNALVYTPPLARLKGAAPDGLLDALLAVAKSLGYVVYYETETGYADGWCRWKERVIAVRASLSGADRAAVLCHELAHALAHVERADTTTAQRELQAEGAAYVALAALGLDTARASLPYLKGWAGDDDALLAELSAIDRIAADLIRHVEAALA